MPEPLLRPGALLRRFGLAVAWLGVRYEIVEEVTVTSLRLLSELVTTAAPRDREVEAARARTRAEKRFGAAA